jgi:hypothetical protein
MLVSTATQAASALYHIQDSTSLEIRFTITATELIYEQTELYRIITGRPAVAYQTLHLGPATSAPQAGIVFGYGRITV